MVDQVVAEEGEQVALEVQEAQEVRPPGEE